MALDTVTFSHVVSGEASRRFNKYFYSRKLLIRKSVDDNSGILSIFYYESDTEFVVGYHVISCAHIA